MKKTLIAASGILIFITIYGCSHEGNGFLAKLLKGGGSAVPVTVESVIVRDRSYPIKAPATIQASESIDVTMSNEATIDRVFISIGDRVERGEPLFTVSERDTTSKIARIRTELRDARDEIEKNTYLFQNRDRLLEEGRLEQDQYDELEPEIEANEAKAEKLQTELNGLNERLGNNTVTSPMRGVVSNVIAAPGMTIPAGKPTATVEDVDTMIAVFRLASYESSTVKNGMNVNVSLPDLSGQTFKGRIIQIDSILDPKDQMFEVDAQVQNPKGFLKVGMNAEVEFRSSEKQRFYLIPVEALIRERRRYYVFTVISGVAHKVQVVPKEKRGKYIEIAKGLRKDDLVVAKGHDKLTEGTVVDIWGR